MRNDLIMPAPPLEAETPYTTTSGRGWGDNPRWFAANWTPNP
jgi:hypothetical protein